MIRSTIAFVSFAFIGCVFSGSDGDDGDEIPSYSVSGTVVDFQTGAAVTGSASVSTNGLDPAPTISTTGADFTLEGVPPGSVFHLLVGNPPEYRSTFSAIEVTDSDLEGVAAEVTSEAYLAELATAFGVTPTSETAVLIAQIVDGDGEPVAMVPEAAFDLGASAIGPFFLDADRAADPGAVETSASGFVVVFEVPPGLYSFAAATGSGVTMVMPQSPSAARAATIARVVVSDGEAPELPVDVSFSADVAPIFENRGCVNCHSGSGIGKDLGGLHLNGEANKMHKELVTELSETHGIVRVDIENPDNSLMLTQPSPEDPPDAHPNVTFASPADPDYLTIKAWIAEGALNN